MSNIKLKMRVYMFGGTWLDIPWVLDDGSRRRRCGLDREEGIVKLTPVGDN